MIITKIKKKKNDEEIECTDKIRYTVLMKVMCCLIKVCKKKRMKKVKRKIENKKMVILIKL